MPHLSPNVHVVSHPVSREKLSTLRNELTSNREFREVTCLDPRHYCRVDDVRIVCQRAQLYTRPGSQQRLGGNNFRRSMLCLAWFLVQPGNFPQQSTPVGPYTGTVIVSKIGLLPIMRAGLGMTEPLLRLWPDARVYHLGLFRFVSLF